MTCSRRLPEAKLRRDCFAFAEKSEVGMVGGYHYPYRCSSKRAKEVQSLPCADTTDVFINFDCQTVTWIPPSSKGYYRLIINLYYILWAWTKKIRLGLDWIWVMKNTFSEHASSAKIGFHKRAKPLELISIIPLCAPLESWVQFAFISMCHETAYRFFFFFFCSWSILKSFPCLLESTGVGAVGCETCPLAAVHRLILRNSRRSQAIYQIHSRKQTGRETTIGNN